MSNVSDSFDGDHLIIRSFSRFPDCQREEWFDSDGTISECHSGMFDQQSSDGSHFLGEEWSTSSWQSNRSYTNQSNHVNQSTARSSMQRERERRISSSWSMFRYPLQMNDDDDFGQYTCVAENTHGRTEGIVFVLRESSLFYSMTLKGVSSLLEESTVLSTLPTTMITPRKTSRYSKYSLSRTMNSTRTYLAALTSTTAYVERDIRLSSSATRPWFSSLWILLWIRLKALQRWAPSFTHVCVCACVSDSDRTMFILHHVHPASLASWMARCR